LTQEENTSVTTLEYFVLISEFFPEDIASPLGCNRAQMFQKSDFKPTLFLASNFDAIKTGHHFRIIIESALCLLYYSALSTAWINVVVSPYKRGIKT